MKPSPHPLPAHDLLPVDLAGEPGGRLIQTSFPPAVHNLCNDSPRQNSNSDGRFSVWSGLHVIAPRPDVRNQHQEQGECPTDRNTEIFAGKPT